MEPGAEGTFGASNSSVTHLLQFTSQQQGDMHEQQKDEIQQQGEQQEQHKVTQGLQQQHNPEEHSNQQEQFEQGRMQHPEQSQLRLHDRHEHRHLEPHQLQQEQHWQPEQQQQLQQVQMQQMLQQPQPHNLQEMHTQHLQNPQQQQHELPLQLQQQQQELPSQLQPQQQELHLQSQRQELPSQSQRQEVPSQLQQQQLPPQLQQEHLNQLLQTQQQQVEQSPLQPQQQHLQQLPQPQQQYLLHSQQQPQQSSAQLQQPQHQLPQAQQQPQHQLPLQQHLPQSQQQLQQSSLKSQQQQSQHFSQPQQQTQQLPQQSQEQHLLQSQQQPQEQLQQSLLPSQHQHLQQLPQPQHQPQQQLQQSPLLSQQQHLQRLPQLQQQPQQKLQQLPLQQQQQHLQQSQQQPQQQLPQPQKQHLQQLLAPQQQHSQQLPQSQQQIQQQPHLQQLSQSQQQIQQQQLQPQVQQQQQQQFNHQQPLQPAVGQATISSRGQNASGSHSISFGSLIPMILPHLSREQSERLQGLYSRLRRNEVTKEDFLRATRNVVGDQMLVQAVRQMQQKQQAQSQLAPSSQANQQQQQQRLQQHTQGTSPQFVAQQSIHTQQLNEPQPFQQVSPVNLQQQAQRTSDYQPHSETSTTASLTVAHSSSDNKPQLRQAGEQCSEIPSVHGNQTSTINLHQVKHEVDRTMIGMPASNQQQQQHMQVPQSPFSMYGRTPGNYSSHSFSVSPIGVKAPPQDSQTRQVMHPQVGVQVQGGPPQLSNVKTTPKNDLSKLSKRREDEERQKMLQSGGTSHSSGQHQPSVWATSLDKEKAGNTGISPLSSVHIKQEINDNSDQQRNIQTLQPMTDNISTIKGVALEHGQSSVLPKTEGVEHQSIKTGGISSANTSIVNQPFGSSGVYSDHSMQAPLATSSSTLHHTLSGFGGPISGGHPSGNPLQGQVRVQVPLTSPSSVVGSQIKTPPKKMLIGQKKPYEVTGPTQLASKKQKVSGGYLDQSIDQLNDVTAVSGVNLREEEEQLFAGPKEESRATEAMRRVVQEEEERTFLQKGPLRAKLVGIMAKYGLKYISSDSERCLSLCVEERLRTMIGHLIRLSKQRGDLERVSHKVAITSDVRRQIHAMNKKAKDDLEKKQAEEAEKLRKLNEAENNVGPEGEKDETRTKAQKAQKEEDDKMRANAANVAARAAVGGDDMLSKWQLMAEQARQKREGASDGASNSRTNRDVIRKTVVSGLKSANVSDHQDAPSTGIVRNLGRTLGPLSQTKSMHTICVKDVIALLEREPQMTKSTLLYRLYERGSECNKERGPENQNNVNTLQ